MVPVVHQGKAKQETPGKSKIGERERSVQTGHEPGCFSCGAMVSPPLAQNRKHCFWIFTLIGMCVLEG
jgi:hypothetical protein